MEKVGFMLDYGDDESGLFAKHGGAARTIASMSALRNRSPKADQLKSSVDVAWITEHSVNLSDGTELPADLIVCATSYGTMDGWAAD